MLVIPSNLLSSSFNFILFWAIQPIHHTHIHTIQSLIIISPLPPDGKKMFLTTQAARWQGRSLIFQGACMCVCVQVGSPFSLPLSLFTLYLFIVTTSSVITTLFFFPCRSSTVEKGELSLHPSISHSFFSNPVVTSNSLFLPLCSLLVDLLDSWELSFSIWSLFKY